MKQKHIEGAYIDGITPAVPPLQMHAWYRSTVWLLTALMSADYKGATSEILSNKGYYFGGETIKFVACFKIRIGLW